MKLLKLTDLFVQALLFIAGIVMPFAFPGAILFIYFYFFLGGWQLLSLAAHWIHDKNLFFRKERLSYAKTILWLLLCGLFSWALFYLNMPILLLYLFVMLFVSPFLAIWYFSICLREIQLMNKKELIHLK